MPGKTRYLLLDEPTSSLDLAHQHNTLAAVRRFANEGVGVLTILHDLNLAAQFANCIVVLKDGRQLASGRPHDVLTPEVMQAAFAVSTIVLPHPRLDCPLIVPLEPQEAFPAAGETAAG